MPINKVDLVERARSVQRFATLPSSHTPGDRWFVNETSAKVNGVWC